MDVLYEESAANHKQEKNAKFYTIANVVFWIFVVLSAAAILNAIIWIPIRSPESTDEEWQMAVINFFAQLIPLALMVSATVFAAVIKRKINVGYDYIFVSGELRIARIFNVNRRKFLYQLQPEEIMQIGDVDGVNFERLRSDPATKLTVCTSNPAPAEDKFFMYILAKEGSVKRLYVLECRETLLTHMLKFVRRGTLEREYVSQEQKQALLEKEEAKKRALQQMQQGEATVQTAAEQSVKTPLEDAEASQKSEEE